MAVMIMQWDGVTTAQYDAVREVVGWERNPAGVVCFMSRRVTSMGCTSPMSGNPPSRT